MAHPFARRAVGWLAALVVLAAAPAGATVIVDRPLEDLASHAHVIVRGVVTAEKVGWNEDHSLIVTRTFVKPAETLKGATDGLVIVRQVGGSLEGRHLAVQGMARFRIGEEVVLFLERHPAAPGEFVLEAMNAAKFTVIRTRIGAFVQRSLKGLTLARPGKDGVLRPQGAPPAVAGRLPWSEFLRTVRAAPALPAVDAPDLGTR